MRLDSYLTTLGIASRREAKKYIEGGLVKVNGKRPSSSGMTIDLDHHKISLDKKIQIARDQKETVLAYKPRGCISSHDEGKKNIFEVFPQYAHLHCVGRLDRDTNGLILLSNDGLITKAITGVPHIIEKEYLVKVREDVIPWMMEKMQKGIKLRDGWAVAVHAEKIDKHTFSVTLKDGRKHQVRRMANALKLTITSLTRVRIGHLRVRSLRAGQVRKLRPQDIRKIINQENV
ncbi:MAG: 23S rRNA pseudouridine2605 synthase [Planctomycetota bacterium]|jgi:23S rRNA pseudouridine2605 synthase